jgi:hypothetical protein
MKLPSVATYALLLSLQLHEYAKSFVRGNGLNDLERLIQASKQQRMHKSEAAPVKMKSCTMDVLGYLVLPLQ